MVARLEWKEEGAEGKKQTAVQRRVDDFGNEK